MAATPDPGLCSDCAFHRVVESVRGSRYWLCQRSRFDARFPRYPRLPVLACPGFRALPAGSPPDSEHQAPGQGQEEP